MNVNGNTRFDSMCFFFVVGENIMNKSIFFCGLGNLDLESSTMMFQNPI